MSATSSNSFTRCPARARTSRSTVSTDTRIPARARGVSPTVRESGPRTFIRELRDRALDAERVADLEVVDVLRGVAGVVFLDEERELAGGVGLGDGGVRAHDGAAFGVREGGGVGGADEEAGGDGEERGFVVRELEDEAAWVSAGRQARHK